ncbi:hypothetical protein [Acetobacterium wieringae]|uniref:hypothetical protein n=1 Tax=Acetobacterium wieringae TaxID=52694 RepID=UPI002B20194A|nr:hypothetical protein [Acetobacterium wieringae]MEA4804373.1 hypothetical protein [Acetobacterium wieringae]
MKKDYIIRQANSKDIDRIMGFIKEHWSSNHILANCKEFFEYEYRYDDTVNYVIAENVISSDIGSVLGFITYGKTNSDIMLALWKSKEKKDPFLGVEVLNYLLKKEDTRIVACCGINNKTIGIYEYLGFYTGKLEHFYRLSEKKDYTIAKISDSYRIPVKEKEYQFVLLKDFHELEKVFDFTAYKNSNPKPYKEPWYIKKRYFNHLVYNYEVYGIKNKSERIESIIFTRTIEVQNKRVLRIVDFIGNIQDLNFISYEVEQLLKTCNFEYVDFYQFGISKEIMKNAGFLLKSDTKNIIPNYFEPFVQENMDIYYFTTDSEGFTIFKGDGDQDRPNFYRSKMI